MEDIDIKQVWNQYREMEQKNILTRDIIARMINDRAKSRVKNFLNMEYTGLVVVLPLNVFLVITLAMYRDNLWITVFSAMGIAILFAITVWSIYKIKLMRSVNFGSDSFRETLSKILFIRKLLAREKLGSVILLPFILLSVYPSMLLVIKGEVFMENLEGYLFRMFFGILAGLIVIVFLYRDFYFKNIDSIRKEYEELSSIEKEADPG